MLWVLLSLITALTDASDSVCTTRCAVTEGCAGVLRPVGSDREPHDFPGEWLSTDRCIALAPAPRGSCPSKRAVVVRRVLTTGMRPAVYRLPLTSLLSGVPHPPDYPDDPAARLPALSKAPDETKAHLPRSYREQAAAGCGPSVIVGYDARGFVLGAHSSPLLADIEPCAHHSVCPP